MKESAVNVKENYHFDYINLGQGRGNFVVVGIAFKKFMRPPSKNYSFPTNQTEITYNCRNMSGSNFGAVFQFLFNLYLK